LPALQLLAEFYDFRIIRIIAGLPE